MPKKDKEINTPEAPEGSDAKDIQKWSVWTQGPKDAKETKRKFKQTTPGQVRDYKHFVSSRRFTQYEQVEEVQPKNEDAPTNSVAGGGVDMAPNAKGTKVFMKKFRVDGRTKEYREANRRIKDRQEKIVQRQVQAKLDMFGVHANPFAEETENKKYFETKDGSIEDAIISALTNFENPNKDKETLTLPNKKDVEVEETYKGKEKRKVDLGGNKRKSDVKKIPFAKAAEEVEIDELSDTTMSSYSQKASASQASAEKKQDYKTADKRISGKLRATRRKFSNDTNRILKGLKKESKETENGERDAGSDKYTNYTKEMTPGQGITSDDAKKADVRKKKEQAAQQQQLNVDENMKYLNTKPGSIEEAILKALMPEKFTTKHEKGDKHDEVPEKKAGETDKDHKDRQAGRVSFKSHRKSLDKVDPDELKGKHKDRDDKDIDNDGDSDDSDKYLHRRRQAIASRRKKDAKEEVEVKEKTIMGVKVKKLGTQKDSETADVKKAQSGDKDALVRQQRRQKVGYVKNNQAEEVEVDEKYTQTQRNIKDISRDYSTGGAIRNKDEIAAKARKATSKGQNVATDRQTDRKHGGDTVVNRKSERDHESKRFDKKDRGSKTQKHHSREEVETEAFANAPSGMKFPTTGVKIGFKDRNKDKEKKARADKRTWPKDYRAKKEEVEVDEVNKHQARAFGSALIRDKSPRQLKDPKKEKMVGTKTGTKVVNRNDPKYKNAPEHESVQSPMSPLMRAVVAEIAKRQDNSPDQSGGKQIKTPDSIMGVKVKKLKPSKETKDVQTALSPKNKGGVTRQMARQRAGYTKSNQAEEVLHEDKESK